MTVRHFRLLVVASLVLGVLGGFIDLSFPGLLPDGFHRAQEANDSAVSGLRLALLGLLGAATLFVLLACSYGLYMLRPWAPRLSLLATVLGLLLVLISGAYAQSGLAIAVSYLASYSWGAVVLVAFLPPFSEQFRRRADSPPQQK